ncbi:hypothetical protein BDR26DRAFT_807373 [Obelidium mucronatum]|nr:hypothetical protein BDR26DRAFT_807373 [Obelidium mucronatum]
MPVSVAFDYTPGTNCPPGFYCPFLDPSDPTTYPSLCPPTTYCAMVRLLGNRCMPQGLYEPMLCWYGFYCPDPQTIIAWYVSLISGSVAPQKCGMFSICPTGTIAEANYSFILLFILLDVILFSYLTARKCSELVKQGLPPLSVIPGYSTWAKYRKRQIRKRRATSRSEQIDRMTRRESFITGNTGDYCTMSNQENRESNTINVPDLSKDSFNSAFNGIENLRMNLKFTDLRYCLGEKVILDSVSGDIKAGRMTAILGPSGAGKTTFVNVLMGKVARTSGDLTINGVQTEMHNFRKIIGYVPQDDVMLRELTVREVILYSARTRLPKDWCLKRVDDLVDAILKVLNLEHIAHTLIGDELNRGISGGQRKRVNIAMELASAPLALILDEPTSGLDSTSALKVSKILRSISRVGLTVVSIIHQPRIEIFNTFDDVLMIIPGGKTAYFGPVKKAKSYFEDFLGFQFDKESNPADVMMDILSGRGKMSGGGGGGGGGCTGTSMKPEAIARSWKEGGHRFVFPGEEAKAKLVSDSKAVESMKSVVSNRGASFLSQCWNAHQRSLTQQARTSGALFMEIWVGMIAGLIMGIAGRCDEMYHGVLVAPYRQLSSTPNEWFLGLYGTLIGVAVAVAGGPAGVRLFGEEKIVYWREAASGHSSLAYFLGKNVSSVYRVALSSLHFTAIYVFFSKPSYAIELQYSLVFLNFLCIYGVAIMVSMVVRRENASLMTVIIGLFLAIFDGFAPTLADARKAGVEFIFSISPNRWASEAQYGLALETYQGLYDLNLASSYFGYELHHTSRNLIMMIALALAYRLVGYLLMILVHRDKQR